MRESELDVKCMDLVRSSYRERPIFHTFNHPTNWLLNRVAERIAEKLTGISISFEDPVKNEYLGDVVQAVPNYLAEILNLDWRQEDYTVSGHVIPMRQLVDEMYSLYSSIDRFDEVCRANGIS